MGESVRRRLIVACLAVAALIVAYWTMWFAHRSLVASSSGALYVGFEQAFPLADGLIVLFVLLGAHALRRRSPSAVLFLLLAAGAGFYLGAMDVLFDLEHSIWFRGANGLVELAINIVTIGASLFFSAWTWAHRRELDPPQGEGQPAGR
ncbi:MAG: hypothetical protein HIU84_07855 [Acidobacteria bacterium]|nr:hypothetical protein [Acidobacteriota bacterium]